ncbi:MAG: DMT family transporter [Chloroflexota bacterium]
MNTTSFETRAYMALGAGIIAASFATTAIRLTQNAGMDSMSLVTFRLTLITLLMAPFALRNGRTEWAALERRDWLLAIVAGVLLAMHFIAFISSLEYTSVINNQTLNGTSPLFAAAAGWLIFRERLNRRILFGIALAFAGSLLINFSTQGGNPPTREAPLLGNSLATAGAAFFALYLVLGRNVRGKMNWLPYSWMVFGLAALTMWILNPILQIQMFGYSREAYLWAIAVTLLAQLITHSSFNFAVGQISPTLVSMATMVIPIGATTVALFVLDEVPGVPSIIGALIILVGVGLANLRPARD